MHTVLITDGEQRAALAIVRSLGAAGYRCIVCSASARSIAGASRHAGVTCTVADPAAAADAFAADIERIVSAEHVDVLIPVSEAALLALLPARERLHATLPFVDLPAFQAICDKERVLDAATRVGISVPGQTAIHSASDVDAVAFNYPLVLKPARSVFTDENGVRGKVSVTWVRSAADLGPALDAYPPAAFPVLAQQAITGPGVGVFVLLHEGRLLASFAHRRIREKPPSGGVSVLRQSEPVDPILLERSLALLRVFGWTGVAMIEYKLDERTGEAFLMEINGRFWGSLQLAVDAGVDFPRMLAAASLQTPVQPVHDHRFVRSRWFWGDVDHVIGVWRDRGSTTGARMAALGGWLRAFGPGYSSEVFRWSDPLPFALETVQWFRSLLRR